MMLINFVNHSFQRHGSCLQRAKTVATQRNDSDETMLIAPAWPLQRRLTAFMFLKKGWLHYL